MTKIKLLAAIAAIALACAPAAARAQVFKLPPTPIAQPDVYATGSLDTSSTTNAYTITLGAAQKTVTVTLTGLTAAGATLVSEYSDNNGMTWGNLASIGNNVAAPSTTFTADGQVSFPVAAHTQWRLRPSVAGAGPVAITSNLSQAQKELSIGGKLNGFYTPPPVVDQGSAGASLGQGATGTAANSATTQGLGTAGTPAGGVNTVQGAPGMVPIASQPDSVPDGAQVTLTNGNSTTAGAVLASGIEDGYQAIDLTLSVLATGATVTVLESDDSSYPAAATRTLVFTTSTGSTVGYSLTNPGIYKFPIGAKYWKVTQTGATAGTTVGILTLKRSIGGAIPTSLQSSNAVSFGITGGVALNAGSSTIGAVTGYSGTNEQTTPMTASQNFLGAAYSPTTWANYFQCRSIGDQVTTINVFEADDGTNYRQTSAPVQSAQVVAGGPYVGLVRVNITGSAALAKYKCSFVNGATAQTFSDLTSALTAH